LFLLSDRRVDTNVWATRRDCYFVTEEKTGPKKPLTAFMFFNMETRPKVVEENPGIAFGEVGKKLGAMWKTLSEDDKAPYAEKAIQDKKRYEKEVAEDKGKPKHEDEDEDDE
jgi:hypothetical protein